MLMIRGDRRLLEGVIVECYDDRHDVCPVFIHFAQRSFHLSLMVTLLLALRDVPGLDSWVYPVT